MASPEYPDQKPAPNPPPPARSRERRWPRILLRTAGVLLVLLLLAAGAAVLWLRSAAKAALPTLDGEIHLAGLSAPVTVRRDAHGVPHIEAANEDDLFVAQGYVTAQDRLWQMDIFRRNANGELAEILGPSLVRHDRTERTMEFRNVARHIYANLPAADRVRFDDYARGVNLFIAQHSDSLPPEFKLLFYRPKPWTGADSVVIGLMMADTLDTHWYAKLYREEIAAKLRNPKLEGNLYPTGSWRDHPPTGTTIDWSQPHPPPPGTKDDEDDDRTQASVGLRSIYPEAQQVAEKAERSSGAKAQIDSGGSVRGLKPPPPSVVGGMKLPDSEKGLRALLGLPDCDGCAPGSNSWVIAGQHTASGRPLLSNDMHLSLTEPNIWLMADLKAGGSQGAPGFHAAGVTLPGVPYVVAGHNEHVAWGFTALYADVQDLYVEKLDGKGNYQAPDGSLKPLIVDHEVIAVRGGRNVELDVESTAHGPLLNPLFPKETRAISLAWTIYDPALNTLPLYAMNAAANWDQFSAALHDWSWPTQNLVYSDDQGHIAYHAIGKVPQRPGGLMGVPIGDAQHEWQRYIPFDEMPSAIDPPSGFLATANARVTADKTLYPLTLEWADPYRIERIYKALQGREQLTPKDMLAVQTDIYSEVDQELAHRFAYAIDHTPGTDDRLHKAADLMRSWDGRLTTGSAAASIVTQTRFALWPLILDPKIGKETAELYEWSESNFAEEEIVMHASPDWLAPGYKNWDALLTEAVRRGLKNGDAPSDVSQWAFGSWHVVDIQHPLSGFVPFISRIAETGPFPLSGDNTTVKQVGRAFGPSQRFTMDWSNVDGSTEDIVLGESSDPYSPYFRDQWNYYYGGTTFALPFTSAAVAAAARHTMRLLP
jgi:penicillin amidase